MAMNRVYFNLTGAPGLSGDFLVGTAVTGSVAGGYRTLGAADDGKSVDVFVTDGSDWEVRLDCVYTHSTTTLTRGTLEESTTGSAINLTAAAKVGVTLTHGRAARVINNDTLITPDGTVVALSEVHAYETLTASGLAFTGACEFSGVIVSAISGTPQTIEVYDNTSATGTPVVTLTATALETKHALGSPGSIQFATGCYVAITGGTSRTLRVLVQ